MSASPPQQVLAPGDLSTALKAAKDMAVAEAWGPRLWAKDASLWPAGEARQRLGWIDAARGQVVDLPALATFSRAVKARKFADAVLIGMGGSSLGPEMIAQIFGSRPGFPRLRVLDSTHPRQIARVLDGLDLTRTLVVASSKSGSTLEPDVLYRHVYGRVENAVGRRVGQHFVAITDPGSQLEAEGRRRGFWRIFHGSPTIGGRFSLFSAFGMAPAAILGLDLAAVFAALQVLAGPSADVEVADSAVSLGLFLGVAAQNRRNKLILEVDPQIADFGGWLEQLIAESTGKLGRGLIPVIREPGHASSGPDRVCVRLVLRGSEAEGEPAAPGSSSPRATIILPGRDSIWVEALRWEVAVALAGAVMGLDPFDQPDVEASKVKTRELAARFTRDGVLPSASPNAREGPLAFYTSGVRGRAKQGADLLCDHLHSVGSGGYVALLAYLDQSTANRLRLETVRRRICVARDLPVVAQFGPRYLHSTGQAFKGGPAGGVFLQLTDSGGPRLRIPGETMDFRTLVDAQALGDFAVMAERRRPILRVDLGEDTEHGFDELEALFDAGL